MKGLKALYVLVPLAVALLSRVFRLHDKISDLFYIRFAFDTFNILFPMATLSGHDLTPRLKAAIRSAREPAMYAVFYRYAGFPEPRIDRQLVRTALDNWGWFWVAVESFALILVTTICLLSMNAQRDVGLCATILLVLLAFLVLQWFVCRATAAKEVRAVLEDSERKSAVRAYFAQMAQG
ncbi:MAG: hypothetical protein WC740_19895 [Verrucomicrobiia bacterium]